MPSRHLKRIQIKLLYGIQSMHRVARLSLCGDRNGVLALSPYFGLKAPREMADTKRRAFVADRIRYAFSRRAPCSFAIYLAPVRLLVSSSR